MNLLSQSAFIKGLGWSLVDSVWQMGLLWLLYHILVLTSGKMVAAKRFNLALVSLLGGLLLFISSVIYRTATGQYSESLAAEMLRLNVPVNDTYADLALTGISTTYILVALLLISRFFLQYRFTNRLSVEGLTKADPELRVFVQERGGQMGIKKHVQVWFSSLVDTPLTIGFWKPMILLPIACINQLSIQQAQAILLHELEHIRRNDYVINLVIAVSSAILFFNPFARVLVGLLKKERENSCDDRVIYYQSNVSEYATALLILEKSRGANMVPALKAIGNRKSLLLQRVRRILTGDQQRQPIDLGLVGLFGLFMTVAVVGWYKKDELMKSPDPLLPFIYAAIEPSIKEQNNKHSKPNLHSPLNVIAEDPDTTLIEQSQIEDSNEYVLYVDEEPDNHSEPLVTFVDDKQVMEYSLHETPNRTPVPESGVGSPLPYIPSGSLSFQLMEDTSINKMQMVSNYQKLARQALEKAIIELEAACKENEGLEDLVQVDLEKLKQELHCLNEDMRSINWQEIEREIREANAQVKNNVRVQQELEKFQKNKMIHQEKVNKLKQQILLERLGSREKKIVEL